MKEGWMSAGQPLDCQFEEKAYKYQFQLLSNTILVKCQLTSRGVDVI